MKTQVLLVLDPSSLSIGVNIKGGYEITIPTKSEIKALSLVSITHLILNQNPC